MDSGKKTEEFYTKLKAQLADTSMWPAPYLYKFIVPASAEKEAQIVKIFDHLGAVIKKNASRTGKYTSVSINVRMKNPDAVIAKYKEVAEVEGVISL
ncbi:DUF493 family protein [Dokdonia sp. MED134]|jgi:putative lipoic acid-binding regulatory protein|uniref:DUF493 family protein n=1 Tax=Dokdonia TaxID=326319 RepID=UPI000068A5DC|nr:DUF493 family protein [Dokdonia sp. MED134]EAQ37900.1 hypothetical protein MED134_14206 [Dokdonia sp. MED134]MDE0597570.1 DUF493 family protein [Dokdonia donghaensis]